MIPFIYAWAVLAAVVTVGGADCTHPVANAAGAISCPLADVYAGSCGGLNKKTDCWESDTVFGDICCAGTSEDCCKLQAGLVAIIVIGIIIASLACAWCCCCKTPGECGVTGCFRGGCCCTATKPAAMLM